MTQADTMSDIRDTYRWKQVRAAILTRDAKTCHYCGDTATTVDHLIPLSKGGAPFEPDNLVAACARCNYAKKNKTAAVFLMPQPPSPDTLSITSPIVTGKQIGRAHV